VGGFFNFYHLQSSHKQGLYHQGTTNSFSSNINTYNWTNVQQMKGLKMS
jgi:hypothetical protein